MRAFIIAAALALAGTATAQTPTSQTPSGQTPTAQVPTNSDYVTAAGQSDAFEIQSGQLASTKAKSADLKAFGARMVTDHTKSTEMVMAAAKKSGMPPAPPPAPRPDQQDMLAQLRAADGDRFDSLYVSQQLQAHQQALDLHTTYARGGGSPELKAAAGKIAPVVTMHLDMLNKRGAGGMAH
jgi:putative membrane protein